jgi:hypothetical protein
MEVHEVVNDSTLEIVPNSTDDDLLANVHDLKVSQMRLLAFGINSAVHFLVIANTVAEIKSGSLGVLAAVIWASGLNIANIGHDELFIIALALNKKNLDAIFVANLQNPLATLQS